jgi:hypothetical protein
MATLTVGVGKEFSTIAQAVSASIAGDTIKVDAGTYTNDFALIDHNVNLVAVGGIVNVVATQQVAKGIFTIGTSTTAPDVSISGFAFSGAKSGQSNGSGIRYQSGNLTLTNDRFVNNQDGILATPFVEGTGNITVNHSTFDHNGAGDGQSHNIYVGYINNFTITNSISDACRRRSRNKKPCSHQRYHKQSDHRWPHRHRKLLDRPSKRG